MKINLTTGNIQVLGKIDKFRNFGFDINQKYSNNVSATFFHPLLTFTRKRNFRTKRCLRLVRISGTML